MDFWNVGKCIYDPYFSVTTDSVIEHSISTFKLIIQIQNLEDWECTASPESADLSRGQKKRVSGFQEEG